MRAEHVAVVNHCIERFVSDRSSPALRVANGMYDHGALSLPRLLRFVFRSELDSSRAIDRGFSALRCTGLVLAWMRENIELTDSLDGLSDREAPEQPPALATAARILRAASF